MANRGPILTAAFALMISAPALAGSYSVEGTGSGAAANTPHPVGEGHVVVDMHTAYDPFELTDTNSPLHGMSGPCFGLMEIASGEVIAGNGLCPFKDRDGETVLIEWRSERFDAEGRNLGIWTIKGGKGKWATATGGGRFSAKVNQDSGRTENRITGSVTLP